jgi:hypothetical protein
MAGVDDRSMTGEVAMNSFVKGAGCRRRGVGEGGSFHFVSRVPPLAASARNHINFLERFFSMNYYRLFYFATGLKL